jgi:hypothetical protein
MLLFKWLFFKRCKVNGCQEFDALKYCEKIALMINKTKFFLSNQSESCKSQ